jgi:tol-pal system protein YbgF
MCIKSSRIFLVAIAMGVLQSASAADSLTLDQRVMRMENLLVNQAEQVQKFEQMRAELTDMREMLEKQTYEMEQIKQRQRNLYQDMDRRLSDLESGKQSSASVAPVAPPTSLAAPTLNAVPVVTSSDAASADPDGKVLYDKAFGLLKDGRYAPSITEFRSFLQRYPQSKFLDNAQYWLAEACYVSRDYPTALKEFQKILTHYKDSGKLQGSELKIGYTYYEMQDWANARTTLESVKSRYPNTTVATKADERLQRMKREGH